MPLIALILVITLVGILGLTAPVILALGLIALGCFMVAAAIRDEKDSSSSAE